MPGPALCVGAGLTYHWAMMSPDPPIQTIADLQGRFPWLYAGVTGAGAPSDQAAALGVSSENVSVSEPCTLCGGGEFFSHRRGDAERQVALLGIRG